MSTADPFYGPKGIVLIVEENPALVDPNAGCHRFFVTPVLLEQTDPNRCLFGDDGRTAVDFDSYEAARIWCNQNELRHEARPWK